VKIAHVNFAVEESVDCKLERFAAVAKSMVVVNISQHAKTCSKGNYLVYSMPGSWLDKKHAPKIQWLFRLFFAAVVVRRLCPDVVILRYPKLPFGWRYFLKWIRVPVVTEHHTDEVAEIIGNGSLIRRAAAGYERFVRKRFLNHTAGIIGVTPEIVKLVKKLNPGVPSCVISNGIDVDSIPMQAITPFNGFELIMIFVASEFVYWQGLDRLLRGMLEYSGDVKLELRLVGVVGDEYQSLIQQLNRLPRRKIYCSGAVYGDELNKYFSGVHLAIGTLGLFRKGMEQACTLKVREYIARGMPFVYGYEDTDLGADFEYALRLANDETPVDIPELIAFVKSLSQKQDLPRQLRQYAESHLDWRAKQEAMIRFVEARTMA
jgi:glycosyltransferase involved in cell wall biosynthesis